jgi:hypothetical protein
MAGGFAWAAIAIADLGVLLYGFLALAMPESLTPGYEAFTGHSWPGLVASDPRMAEFLVLLFRLLGALNVAAGLAGLLIAVVPFRSGARWSWYALLALNGVAFGAPITYDQVVGAIGVPEVLELVAFAVILLALGLSFRRARPGMGSSSPNAASGKSPLAIPSNARAVGLAASDKE